MIGLPGSIASSVLVALWLISDFLQLQTLPVLRFHNAWNTTTGMKESGFKLNSGRERGCNGGFCGRESCSSEESFALLFIYKAHCPC